MSHPEHNVTGIDYARRDHFRYQGPPIVDIHAHVTQVPDEGIAQAEVLLDVADKFGVGKVFSMCPPEDIPPLRERFGDKLGFNGYLSKKLATDADDTIYERLDRFLDLGVEIIKFWAAPRGRERGLFVDAPWRIEAVRRASRAGIRVFMVHVGDPDHWFRTTYADAAKFGTKPDQYLGLRRMLEMFPDVAWIAAHMGGDPEHPDHLESLLGQYPHLFLDTSATKWQVREVSRHPDAIRDLICRKPARFLFGSDLVTRPKLESEHYVSRYWCQRTLWESTWQGRSPIADPDHVPSPGEPATPTLHGVGLPPDVLEQVYWKNALRLVPSCLGSRVGL